MLGEPRGEHALTGGRSVSQHERDLGVTQRHVGELIHRRHAASGMNDDRNARVASQGEDRLHHRSAESERLGQRVQLDPARAPRQAALALIDRVVGGVEPGVREYPTGALARPVEHTIVRSPIGGSAVGIVERERTCAGFGSYFVESANQRWRRQRPPVLVGTQMGVGVEHRVARRQQASNLLGEGRIGGREGDLWH